MNLPTPAQTIPVQNQNPEARKEKVIKKTSPDEIDPVPCEVQASSPDAVGIHAVPAIQVTIGKEALHHRDPFWPWMRNLKGTSLIGRFGNRDWDWNWTRS